MDERIKQIRIDSGKTQAKFAESLGVSLSNIKSYELGLRTPSNAFIKLICSKYNINETWLLTGKGDMHGEVTREQRIASITAAIFQDDSEFRSALIDTIIGLDKDQLAVLQQIADKMLENYKKSNEE